MVPKHLLPLDEEENRRFSWVTFIDKWSQNKVRAEG